MYWGKLLIIDGDHSVFTILNIDLVTFAQKWLYFIKNRFYLPIAMKPIEDYYKKLLDIFPQQLVSNKVPYGNLITDLLEKDLDKELLFKPLPGSILDQLL